MTVDKQKLRAFAAKRMLVAPWYDKHTPDASDFEEAPMAAIHVRLPPQTVITLLDEIEMLEGLVAERTIERDGWLLNLEEARAAHAEQLHYREAAGDRDRFHAHANDLSRTAIRLNNDLLAMKAARDELAHYALQTPNPMAPHLVSEVVTRLTQHQDVDVTARIGELLAVGGEK